MRIELSSTPDPALLPFCPGDVSEGEAFEIVTVQSGAKSLRSREFAQTFHPVVGPMAEARALHVEQQRLVARAAVVRDGFTIWDVGLGAAANALAAIEAFRDFRGAARIELHSFEETLAPLRFALEHAEELSYLVPHRPALRAWMSSSEMRTMWGAVNWQLHLGDFQGFLREKSTPAPHAILYDPYSPRSNPALWTLEHFTRLRARLSPDTPCLLTNYTRSTAVRVTLLLAGFFVGRGCETGEKTETTTAANARELLEAPLDSAWLERVRRSTASAPLRDARAANPAISPADFQALCEHPQFASA